MTWQLQAVEAQLAQPSPDPRITEEQALNISNFILSAPLDFLEPLITSPFGRVYKLFLERCCTNPFEQPISTEQRDRLSQELRRVGCEGQDGWAIILALFPFFPPEQLKIDGASSKLPNWLHDIYKHRYESNENVNDISSAPENSTFINSSPSFDNRIFLNRILGLSNLYYIDPEDQEILDELRTIRLEVIKLMVNVNAEEFEMYFRSDFGDRYWAMAQSGIQNQSLDAKESQFRNTLQAWLSEKSNSLHQDGGIQRFAAILLLTPSGSVQLADPERNLPTWFIEGYKRFNSMAQSK